MVVGNAVCRSGVRVGDESHGFRVVSGHVLELFCLVSCPSYLYFWIVGPTWAPHEIFARLRLCKGGHPRHGALLFLTYERGFALRSLTRQFTRKGVSAQVQCNIADH